jgi:hypothetical protein
MSLADGAEAAPFPARDGPPEDAAPRMKSAFAVDGPAPGAAPPAAPPPPPAGRRAACWHWTRTRLFREQLGASPLDAARAACARCYSLHRARTSTDNPPTTRPPRR